MSMLEKDRVGFKANVSCAAMSAKEERYDWDSWVARLDIISPFGSREYSVFLATNCPSIRRAFSPLAFVFLLAPFFLSYVPWAHPRLPADILNQSNSDQIFSAGRANALSGSYIAGPYLPSNKFLTLVKISARRARIHSYIFSYKRFTNLQISR